jgi:AbrB family looped-hinge helix DNA binding protein
MIIEKVKSRKYKNTQYYKYRITIPSEIISSAGFKEGDELEANATKGKIELKKK